jgi:MFS family permease
MKNDQTTFRDRLLAVEPLSPDSREKLAQELHAMFTRQLSTPHRIVIAIVAVFSLAVAVLCGYLAVTRANLPLVARIGLGTGTLFGLAWALLAARILRKGAINLRFDNRMMAALGWVFTVLLMTFLLMLGMSIEDRLLGVMMIAYGLVFLVGAGVNFVSARIEQAELAMREKMLELELRIAELSERR